MEDSASSLPNNNSDPSPQIQQNVEGDGNQVIGQVTGSNVFGNITGNVTIYDRVPVSSMPPPISVMPTLTQQEYRQRQVLLDKVQKFWVKGVLENSLHSKALIELGLQERLDLVKQPFSGVNEFLDAPGQVLPDSTQATAVFDEMGEGRTLLILGEPGAGKTIALLKLAEDLIIRTAPDLRQQIPVVLNLSSWARKPQTIEKWLEQELLENYQISKALGETWVKSEALILLLDGLDEVRADQRNACVQALNLFMQNHGTTEIVICCRIRDYQMSQDRLMLRSAICLQPLTAAQIDLYFEQAGDRLSALKAVLPQDAELQELAKSPLMLSVMSLAYQDFTPEQLAVGRKIEDYRKRLFATYIDRMFQRRGMMQQYSREDIQRWLIWLAQRMTITSQTMFLIERLQPSWLPKKSQRVRCRLENIFIGIMIIVLSSGLYGGLFSAITGNVNRMLGGLLFGLIFGIIWGCFAGFIKEIKPVERLKWSWKEFRNGFRGGIISGLAIELTSLILPLLIFLLTNKWDSSQISLSFFKLNFLELLFGIIFFTLFNGFFFGMIVAIIGGIQNHRIQPSEDLSLRAKFTKYIKPIERLNWSWQGFRNSFREGMAFGIFLELISILICLLVYALVGLLNNWFVGNWSSLQKILLVYIYTSITIPYTLFIFTLFYGIFFGLIGATISAFKGSEIQQKEKPNQGILKSAWNAAIVGMLSLFVGSLIGGLINWGNGKLENVVTGIMSFGLIAGLFFGLIYGGNACIRHFTLRQMLYRKGYAPWNYAHFLDSATERLFLQKVGGGYIFVHRMLLEHFAEMSLEQEKS